MRAIASVLIAALLLCTGCAPQQKPTGELSLSKDILFSIYYPGDGEGTVAPFSYAYISVHTDGTLQISMTGDIGFTSVKTFGPIQMSPEDYDALVALADPDEIYALQLLKEIDFSNDSRYILLHDENNDVFARRGGVLQQGIRFQKIYEGILEVLDRYNVRTIMLDWAQTLANEEENK